MLYVLFLKLKKDNGAVLFVWAMAQVFIGTGATFEVGLILFNLSRCERRSLSFQNHWVTGLTVAGSNEMGETICANALSGFD